MGGSVSLSQIYTLPELIDRHTFHTITKGRFSEESYDIFSDRDGQISRERFKEIVSSRDCYLSYEWGYDSLGRSVPNRVSQITEYLNEKGLYIYAEDGSYRHNVPMGKMSLRERIRQSLKSSSCLVLCLTKRYYEKLTEEIKKKKKKAEKSQEDRDGGGVGRRQTIVVATKKKEEKNENSLMEEEEEDEEMNQIQIEFYEFLQLKKEAVGNGHHPSHNNTINHSSNNEALRYIIPLIFEESGKISSSNPDCPSFFVEMFSNKFCFEMLDDFSRFPQQLEELYEHIIKTIKPLQNGGNFIKAGLEYALTTEGKHFHWLAGRFIIEDDGLKLSNTTTTTEEKGKDSVSSSSLPSLTIGQTPIVSKGTNKEEQNNKSPLNNKRKNAEPSTTMEILANLKNLSKMKISRTLLKTYAELFTSHHLETTTRLIPLLQGNDNYLIEIGILPIHSGYLRNEILKDIKENFDSKYLTSIDKILSEKKKIYSKEDFEKQQKLQQLLENSSQMKELSLMSYEDQLSYTMRNHYELLEKQETFLKKQEKLWKVIQEENEQYSYLVSSLKESTERRQYEEINERRAYRYEKIINASSIFEIMQYFRETIAAIEVITFAPPVEELLLENAMKRSMSFIPSHSPVNLSSKKGMTVDISYLPSSPSRREKKGSLSSPSLDDGDMEGMGSPSSKRRSIKKKLVPYGLTKQLSVTSNINATKDSIELSYLLQESLYILKKMELLITSFPSSMESGMTESSKEQGNPLQNVTTYIENGFIKLFLSYLSSHYLHNLTFVSSYFTSNPLYYELKLPFQPLYLLSRMIRSSLNYDLSYHKQLVYLLHRQGIVCLLFEILKFYIEKIEILSFILYLIDLLFMTKEYAVLENYIANLLSTAIPSMNGSSHMSLNIGGNAVVGGRGGNELQNGRNSSSSSSNGGSATNEFYLLLLMIILEKYYYHAKPEQHDGDDDDDDLRSKKGSVVTTATTTIRRNRGRNESDDSFSPSAVMKPPSPLASPVLNRQRSISQNSYTFSRTSSSSALLIRSPSSPAFPLPATKTDPLIPFFNQQIHLLYEPYYKESFLMIICLFLKLVSLSSYDTLLMKCREKLISTLFNEFLTIPITNLSLSSSYFINFLFSIETLYYNKLIVFLPQNTYNDSCYHLSQLYGLYDTSLSYALKKERYLPTSFSAAKASGREKSNLSHRAASFSSSSSHQSLPTGKRKLSEIMILQFHEVNLLKYLMNAFHYYGYHYDYQNINIVIQLIRCFGNIIYCRNDLKKIVNEAYLGKELVNCLKVGLYLMKNNRFGETSQSQQQKQGSKESNEERENINLTEIHKALQEEMLEKEGKSKKKGRGERTSEKKEGEGNQPTKFYQKVQRSLSKDYDNNNQYQPSDRGIDNENIHNTSSPFPSMSGSPNNVNNKGRKGEFKPPPINRSRLLGIQLLIETLQTLNNLLVIYSDHHTVSPATEASTNSKKEASSTSASSFLRKKVPDSKEKKERKAGTEEEMEGGESQSFHNSAYFQKNPFVLSMNYLIPKWDCLVDCIEKYSLCEILMELFLYLSFDPKLLYSYLLLIHKITQKGNYIVNNRLITIGFIEKVSVSCI
jgi:hypothetical protein